MSFLIFSAPSALSGYSQSRPRSDPGGHEDFCKSPCSPCLRGSLGQSHHGGHVPEQAGIGVLHADDPRCRSCRPASSRPWAEALHRAAELEARDGVEGQRHGLARLDAHDVQLAQIVGLHLPGRSGRRSRRPARPRPPARLRARGTAASVPANGALSSVSARPAGACWRSACRLRDRSLSRGDLLIPCAGVQQVKLSLRLAHRGLGLGDLGRRAAGIVSRFSRLRLLHLRGRLRHAVGVGRRGQLVEARLAASKAMVACSQLEALRTACRRWADPSPGRRRPARCGRAARLPRRPRPRSWRSRPAPRQPPVRPAPPRGARPAATSLAAGRLCSRARRAFAASSAAWRGRDPVCARRPSAFQLAPARWPAPHRLRPARPAAARPAAAGSPARPSTCRPP